MKKSIMLVATLCVVAMMVAGCATMCGEKAGCQKACQAKTNMPAAEKLGFKVGCQAYSFNKFTFYEAIDKTAAAGFNYIEAYPGQALSPEKMDVKFDQNLPADLQKEVLAKLEAANVKLVNYGVLGLGADEAENRKIFEFAKAMGIETITSEPKQEDLPAIDKLAQEYGINVALHNHPKDSRYWNPDTVLEAVKGLSPRVGACADTGHWMRSDINPVDGLKKLEGRIISLHFKDLNMYGKEAANKEDVHDVVWGTGKADVPALLAELKRQGFKGVFSAEYEYDWLDSVPELTESGQNFERICQDLVKK
ncbi:MAG: sugar phosphate isomerase/epimerase [FCB group bacterium]|nr:sugar phosphate isomerase/epimerase [FCB group bacterium]